MKFNLIINIGDIILQTKDNIVFTVVNKDKKNIYLEYYDRPFETRRTFEITTEKLKIQFETRSDYLTLIRVIK
jgi:hypothetical protein